MSAYESTAEAARGSFDNGLSNDFSNNNELSFLVDCYLWLRQRRVGADLDSKRTAPVDGGNSVATVASLGPEPAYPIKRSLGDANSRPTLSK